MSDQLENDAPQCDADGCPPSTLDGSPWVFLAVAVGVLLLVFVTMRLTLLAQPTS